MSLIIVADTIVAVDIDRKMRVYHWLIALFYFCSGKHHVNVKLNF